MSILPLLVVWLYSGFAWAAGTSSGGDGDSAWVRIVKDVGVPIAMLAWFIWRDKYQMQKIIDLLGENSKAMALWSKSNEDIVQEISGKIKIPLSERREAPTKVSKEG